jgi:acyl carrier protein
LFVRGRIPLTYERAILPRPVSIEDNSKPYENPAQENLQLADKSVEENLFIVLRRDHAVEMTAADLDTLTPGDVGLDSLSEAELYIELSDLLGISQIDSPESGKSFRDIVEHFQARLGQ